MRMVNLRAPYNARRVALTLAVILLVGFLLLPSQLQGVFQQMGGPVGWIVSWPLRAMAGVSDGISNAWTGFVVLQGVEEEK
jgi:rod shape-determining protein MreC